MSASEIQSPIHEVRCDREGCDATFVSTSNFSRRSNHGTRIEAGRAGWDVPPVRGKGSRSESDYCPKHPTRTSA